nr:prepilin-type N-terminal cleavage/methylation domain-containing protein [Maliibacterium massiliense]
MVKALRRNKRGFTLIEVLVAVAILAILIVPLLSLFAQSASNGNHADAIVRATFSAITVLEERNALTYEALLAHASDTQGQGNLRIVTTLSPYGSADALAGAADPAYLHVVLRDTYALVLCPDGAALRYDYPAGDMTLNVTSTSVLGHSFPLAGHDRLIVLVHGQGNLERALRINQGSGCYSVFYTAGTDASRYTCNNSAFARVQLAMPNLLVNVRVEAFDASGTRCAMMQETLSVPIEAVAP